MNGRSSRLVALLLAGSLVAAACSSDDAIDTSSPDTGSSETETPTSSDPPDSAATDEAQAEAETPVIDDEADGPVVPVVVAGRFDTATQMLLANEINESGEPFAEALGYNLDDLDPFQAGVPDDQAYVLGIENYEYSRYQLGNVVRNSGLGLHMMWAPLVSRAAAAEPDSFDGSFTGAPNGVKEDDKLIQTIMAFSNLSGEMPPAHAWPQFAEFASGDPHMPQPVDADNFAWADVATMRWDRSLMEKELQPGAMGQTLMKQYLWAQDMLSAFHDGEDEGIEADGVVSPDSAGSNQFDPNNNVFFGGDARDGFIGLVLTAQGLNKIAFLTNALAFDGSELGRIDLATYDPAEGLKYFPHSTSVTEAPVIDGLPPRADGLTVSDPTSRLWDQASLLWGTTSFTDMMNPADVSDSAHVAYKSVFDGSPFPASASETGSPGPYDLMKGTSRAIFLNLMAMHWDPEAAVFVDEAKVDDEGAVERGDEVSVVGGEQLIVALEGFIAQFAGTPLEAAARQAVADEAGYLVAHLSDGEGRYVDSGVIGEDAEDASSLTSQAAAVRALYVAARVTGSGDLRAAADAAYGVLMSDYHVDGSDLFRTDIESSEVVYTPENVALLAGALREATLEGGHAEASQTYVSFFLQVGNRMQLSEGASTGETGGDSDGDGIPFIPEQPDGLAPVFAAKATFELD